jgi:hypothetical protein
MIISIEMSLKHFFIVIPVEIPIRHIYSTLSVTLWLLSVAAAMWLQLI